MSDRFANISQQMFKKSLTYASVDDSTVTPNFDAALKKQMEHSGYFQVNASRMLQEQSVTGKEPLGGPIDRCEPSCSTCHGGAHPATASRGNTWTAQGVHFQ